MTCQLCGSKKLKVIKDTLRYGIKRKVWQCEDCGFIFLDNKKIDFSGKYYRQHYSPAVGKSKNSREIFDIYLPFQQKFIDEIKHLLKPTTKVLDVGCSSGYFLHALKGRVGERVGVEMNPADIEFIKKNLDFKVYNQPIETVKIKEAPFDLAVCLNTLGQIENPLEFLKNIGKQLKPNGHLYIDVRNIDNVFFKYYKTEGYEDFYFCEPELSYFSLSTLKKLLFKAGFVGKFKTIQRYSLINHLSWLLTGKPQKDFTSACSPALFANPKNRIEREINSVIRLMDIKYKNLLNKYQLGETCVFVGRRI